MKKLILFILVIGIASCSSKEPDLVVTGHIKGLQKGTLFLKKMQDSTLITLDSVSINGVPDFRLESALEEPEVFFLVLDKNDTEDGRIQFFADKGTTDIQTTLKNFSFDATIAGSKQQAILQEYWDMSAKYRNKNLDIIKQNFDALKNNDSIKVLEADLRYKSLVKSKYLYTINFALNNNTSAVAPYVALTEVYDARLKYLDTIYTSLPDSIANSKYGKELKTLIEQRKVLEEN